MLRFRYVLPLLFAVLTVAITSSVMASSKKSLYSDNDGYEECSVLVENESHEVSRVISREATEYASDQKIDLKTACHRLALQGSIGGLGADLSRKEADTFAGMWIQHTPEFRLIVQFTREGEKSIRPYIENKPFADIVEVREANYTLKELHAAHAEARSIVRNLDIPIDSGTNVFENRVELYVVDRSRFEVAMQDAKLQLPPQVIVVTVSELATRETDIYGGLALSHCTSGFSVVNSSGVKGILTAAHCLPPFSYNGIDLPSLGSAYGGPFDFRWLSAPGFNVRSLVYDGTDYLYVLATKHRDDQNEGDYVCKHGAATGKTCGFIINTLANFVVHPEYRHIWVKIKLLTARYSAARRSS